MIPRLKKPWTKCEQFISTVLANRKWPSRRVGEAPRWLATDLRDDNQSLASPMVGDEINDDDGDDMINY